jgi:ATP-dependent DNA helicase RecQ
MGIDYPDVRLVAHFQMPANIESFYQEMGRAGRDGNMARCILLHCDRDKGLQNYFIQQSKAEAKVIAAKWRALQAMNRFVESPSCRQADILNYFGDSDRIRRCGHCDRCTPNSQWMVQMRAKGRIHKDRVGQITKKKSQIQPRNKNGIF